MSLPSGGERSENGRHYQFVIPGITFLMLLGQSVGAEMRQIGTWPSGFTFIATEGEARKLTAMVTATKDAARRGKLAKSPRKTGL